MQPKQNLLCASCRTLIGNITNGIMIFNNMPVLSTVEINRTNATTDVKCHTCHNWTNIDALNATVVNYKRKAQDHLK